MQGDQEVRLKEELAAPLRSMQDIARRIAKVSNESKFEIVEQEYIAQFKVDLMDLVMQWCRGAKFSEICKVRNLPSLRNTLGLIFGLAQPAL
jgi:ATP-dependent RNA helicase DOB1